VYKSFTPWVKLIPRYFVIFDVLEGGIVFLIFFSDCSLLAYRNAAEFCVLVLSPANLLDVLFTFKLIAIK
jgi:hypothetical protein